MYEGFSGCVAQEQKHMSMARKLAEEIKITTDSLDEQNEMIIEILRVIVSARQAEISENQIKAEFTMRSIESLKKLVNL